MRKRAFFKESLLFFPEKQFHGKIGGWERFRQFHTVHTVECTVWKLRNFTATVSSQIFRQINVLLKDFTVNQFDEKKFVCQWISRFSTLCSHGVGVFRFFFHSDFSWNQCLESQKLLHWQFQKLYHFGDFQSCT